MIKIWCSYDKTDLRFGQLYVLCWAARLGWVGSALQASVVGLVGFYKVDPCPSLAMPSVTARERARQLGQDTTRIAWKFFWGVRIFVQPIVSRDVSVLILQTYLWGNNGNNCRYTRCLSRLPNERNKAKQYSLLQLAYSSLSGVDRCSSKSSQIILCSFMAVLGHGQGAVVPGLAWKEAKMASRHD